jgi:HTH-type transcriptional regulator, fmd operon transcriptional regulator
MADVIRHFFRPWTWPDTRKHLPSHNTQIMGRRLRASLRAKAFQKTSLTARQWQVIRYRAQGITQAELAKVLNTSRENVNEIEHRARMKISAARATLAALQEIDARGEVLIPSGTDIFEAVFMVILRADVLGVKLKGSADDLLAAIRARWKGRIKGHRLASAVKIDIEKDGSIKLKDTAPAS